MPLFIEDDTDEEEHMAPTQPPLCAHCRKQIRPCRCGAGAVLHWQDATAPRGVGNRHCPGEPHQLHEPDYSTNGR